MSITINESVAITAEEVRSGEWLIRLISPGMGSSGYYPTETLEAAGAAQAFPAGTHMYLDHPTGTEQSERPERSVRDLTGVLAEAAYWDGTALVGRAKVFGPYKETLSEMAQAEAIGMSIRASAVIESGEVEGQRVPIVKEICADKRNSVDFVTHPGRGGKVLEVLESARERPMHYVASDVTNGQYEARSLAAEATANDTREQLERLLAERFPGTDDAPNYIYVRDFDETNVWYFHEGQGLFQLGYTAEGLTGDPIAVRVSTTYIPVGNDDSDNSTADSGEDAVGEGSTVEAEEIQRQLEAAQAELAQYRAREAARPVIESALREMNGLPEQGVQRVTNDVLSRALPIREGQLDADRLAAEVRRAGEAEVAYVTSIREVRTPANPVTGFGVSEAAGTKVDTEKFEESLTEAFKMFDLDDKRAARAARGR